MKQNSTRPPAHDRSPEHRHHKNTQGHTSASSGITPSWRLAMIWSGEQVLIKFEMATRSLDANGRPIIINIDRPFQLFRIGPNHNPRIVNSTVIMAITGKGVLPPSCIRVWSPRKLAGDPNTLKRETMGGGHGGSCTPIFQPVYSQRRPNNPFHDLNRYFSFLVFSPFPSRPFNLISGCSGGWQMHDKHCRQH